MIAIENILVSDDVVEQQFVCDLNKCKGGCCEDGDAGAPLAKEELDIIGDVFKTVKHYLPQQSVEEIERQGLYRYDKDFGWVTPTIDGKICAYGYRDENEIIKCAFEQAFYDGKTDLTAMGWKKPISCHLYPIKTKKSKDGKYEMVNYEPRETLCNPGCSFGKKLKMPVYVFLKEALTRKYGNEFYETLEQTALEYFEAQTEKNHR